MLHTLTGAIYLAVDPPTVTATTPPGSANFLDILGWVLWGCFAVCVVAVAMSGAGLSLAGSGRGGQQAGQHGAGFVIACVGAVITFSSAAIVTALA